jgi:hypothetical protein
MSEKDADTLKTERDPWKHRSKRMLCTSCMFYVEKEGTTTSDPIGRCRRHAPSLGGFPAVYPTDWCGDHKIDENRI